MSSKRAGPLQVDLFFIVTVAGRSQHGLARGVCRDLNAAAGRSIHFAHLAEALYLAACYSHVFFTTLDTENGTETGSAEPWIQKECIVAAEFVRVS